MRIIYFISLALLIGCSSKKEDEKLNTGSIVIHNSMVMKASEIENELFLLKSDSLSTVNKDSIDILLFVLEEWEQDIVEVPGNENHQHSEHKHHDHSHKAPEVTALQMLQIQQEMDKRLEAINKRASDLLTRSQE
jgi:hypothetical protein